MTTRMYPGGAGGALGIRGAIFCDGEDAWWAGCGTCANCGDDVKIGSSGRPSKWFCARRACPREWRIDHQWPEARKAALKRAGGRCQRRPCLQTRRLEVNHKEALADVDPAVTRTSTRASRFADAPGGLGGARLYRTGCQNHQDKLEVICTSHHNEETQRQRIERTLPEVKPAPEEALALGGIR